MTGRDLAVAAQSLIGCRFRLHGRDPATGLDCIGVLAAAMASLGHPLSLPSGYRLRLAAHDAWLPDIAACGFSAAVLPFLPGDVVLLQIGPGQVHLTIAADLTGWVHAHAGLRRIVMAPELPDGPILHHWRLRPVS